MRFIDYVGPTLERLHTAVASRGTSYIRGNPEVTDSWPAPPLYCSGSLEGLNLAPIPRLSYRLPERDAKAFHGFFEELALLAHTCRTTTGLGARRRIKDLCWGMPWALRQGEAEEALPLSLLTYSDLGKLSVSESKLTLTTPVSKYVVTPLAVEWGDKRRKLKRSLGNLADTATWMKTKRYKVGDRLAHQYIVLTQNYPEFTDQLTLIWQCLAMSLHQLEFSLRNETQWSFLSWGRAEWHMTTMPKPPRVKQPDPAEDLTSIRELLELQEMLR